MSAPAVLSGRWLREWDAFGWCQTEAQTPLSLQHTMGEFKHGKRYLMLSKLLSVPMLGQQPVPQGTVLLQALYYYQYIATDGRLIQISEGDQFVLLQKSNEDWWQVRRQGEPKKVKPIYVPAKYVLEVPPGTTGSLRATPAECTSKSGVEFSVRQQKICIQQCPTNSNEVNNHFLEGVGGGGGCLTGHQEKLETELNPGLKSSTRQHNPSTNLELEAESDLLSFWTFVLQTTESVVELAGRSDSPVYTNLEELRMVHLEPPNPINPPVQVLDLWERHVDPATDRNFYFNTVTKEKTWKPPRRARNRMARVGKGFNCRERKYICILILVIILAFVTALYYVVDTYQSASQNILQSMLEKAGLLNKTKIAEGGRKLKKNWSISRVVLVGNSLAFYKETKTQTAASWKPGNRPESSVDLRGSLIEWTKEMSSKKNVFRLRTVTGNEFLFQAENEDYISDWYKTIKNVIETLDRENPLDYQMVYALRRSSSAELLDCSGDEDENPAKEKRDSRMTLCKRVKSRLRKFITKRPPLQSLQEKGLIKDQVFGCRLETLCDREKENVPKFVQLCIDAVEKRGLEADGIYRVSGNLATIQKLRFLVDHERAVTTDGRYLFPEGLCQEEKLNMDDAQWEDVHVITGALKMFFRELPEPLVPYNSFEHFVSAIKIADAAEKVESIKQLVWSLPKPNQDTMRVMFRHLKKVVEHSEANRMTAQSIAIVFGPTLMRSEKDFSNMAVHMVYQNQIVELILVECDGIFNPENKLLR
uniref:Uncharacterized protein n=1 Tax=Callorhinchus milii TaxID=7868 RepID=A0A4W3JTK0_CALMI